LGLRARTRKVTPGGPVSAASPNTLSGAPSSCRSGKGRGNRTDERLRPHDEGSIHKLTPLGALPRGCGFAGSSSQGWSLSLSLPRAVSSRFDERSPCGQESTSGRKAEDGPGLKQDPKAIGRSRLLSCAPLCDRASHILSLLHRDKPTVGLPLAQYCRSTRGTRSGGNCKPPDNSLPRGAC
jgi:hypothetical protein